VRILVADDDAVSRSIMRRLLTQCGYEVTTASNGVEAVDAASMEYGPRLVLLDWMMPELDGPEVCRAIRKGSRRAYVYIILLTSKDSKDDLIAGLEAGADDYLTKPCNIEELRARLRTGERILQLEDNLVAAREEMRFRATHDGLTQLLNRTSVIQRLKDELGVAPECRKQFAVVSCDVDHFKKINDTHGHPVGDEVLCEIAGRLKNLVRASDPVGRFGGEEFLIVFGGCTDEAVPRLAEMLCNSIRSEPISTSAGLLDVSISAGALHVGRVAMDAGLDCLLQAVDTALYQAKAGGRDQFVIGSFPQELLAVA
jgi:two-component system cell cycle response regulator